MVLPAENERGATAGSNLVSKISRNYHRNVTGSRVLPKDPGELTSIVPNAYARQKKYNVIEIFDLLVRFDPFQCRFTEYGFPERLLIVWCEPDRVGTCHDRSPVDSSNRCDPSGGEQTFLLTCPIIAQPANPLVDTLM